MNLAVSFRDTLVEELDDMLEAYGSNPDAEAIAEFVIEQLEMYADENAIDDIIPSLEESGELDSPLQELLENEMASNDEFEYTGEEVVSLIEKMCQIEWDDEEEEEDEGDDDEEDDDDFDDE